jgi:hypothetical protein
MPKYWNDPLVNFPKHKKQRKTETIKKNPSSSTPPEKLLWWQLKSPKWQEKRASCGFKKEVGERRGRACTSLAAGWLFNLGQAAFFLCALVPSPRDGSDLTHLQNYVYDGERRRMFCSEPLISLWHVHCTMLLSHFSKFAHKYIQPPNCFNYRMRKLLHLAKGSSQFC